MKNCERFPHRCFPVYGLLLHLHTHVHMHATGIWKTDQADKENEVHFNVATLMCTIHMLASNYAQQSLHYLFKTSYNFPILY